MFHVDRSNPPKFATHMHCKLAETTCNEIGQNLAVEVCGHRSYARILYDSREISTRRFS